MFSPLGNMKASDKTQKSSLRNVFEADVVYYEKIISHFFYNLKKALDVDVDAILPKETVQF